MTTLRKVKRTDYTVIDNNIFKNQKLTLKAKGMICTMLSLPDNWEFSENGLVELSNDGITSIRSTLKELMEYGYLIRTRNRDEKGILRDYIYTIFEEPTLEKPKLEKPTLENLKTNKILNNKILNNKKKEIYKERKFKKPTLEEVEEYCKERNSNVDPKVFYEYFETGGWVDSKGNKVKNWKQKLITWESRGKKETVPTWFDKQNTTQELTNEDLKEMEWLNGN